MAQKMVDLLHLYISSEYDPEASKKMDQDFNNWRGKKKYLDELKKKLSHTPEYKSLFKKTDKKYSEKKVKEYNKILSLARSNG